MKRLVRGRKHIVVVSKGGWLWTGGRQYTLNLVEALGRYQGDSNIFDLSLLIRDKDEISHYEVVSQNMCVFSDLESLQAPYSLANRVRWRIKRTIGRHHNPRIDEALKDIGATFSYPICSSQIPSADWIPDFQYKHYPEGSNQDEIAGRKREFHTIVKHAKSIVLSSAMAEDDCHELFPKSVGRTSVLHFRTFVDQSWLEDTPDDIVRLYNLPRKYFLISNMLAPTKNHLLAIDALANLSESDRSGLVIACTGSLYDYRNPYFYNTVLEKIHTMGLRENIIFLGLIPKRHQVQLLRASIAYLQPSLFEGWNTGVEEAAMLGKQILISDIPVHREQNPNGAILFDPYDSESLASKLVDLHERNTSTGYEPEAEGQALKEYALKQRIFAEDFLEIAGISPC